MNSILSGYDGGAHGLLSSDPVVNPKLFNATKAYVRYCDGASFSGNADAAVSGLYFRGHRILDAVIASFLANGLGKAKLLIVNGIHIYQDLCC